MSTKQNAVEGQKSSMVTLRANGSTLTLVAVRKSDGTALTSVTTRDPEKKIQKGMSEKHADMAAAKAHLTTLAEKAEKLGWSRGTRAVVQKPDAFSKLPSAPKAVTA
jgi:hypothetical protein